MRLLRTLKGHALRVLKPIQVGSRTITIYPDYIDLAELTADPPPKAGRLWYNADQKSLKYSDGEAIHTIQISSKCILGVIFLYADAGQIKKAWPYMCWTEPIDAWWTRFPMPYAGVARKLKAYVNVNTLDANCFILCRRNEGEAYIQIEVPAGQTGLFTNDTDALPFNENDYLDFVIDARDASTGSIEVTYLTLLYEG